MSKHKVLLLTGGSKGIGKKLAVEFAKNGYQIAFTYLSDEAGAKFTADEINNMVSWQGLQVGYISIS